MADEEPRRTELDLKGKSTLEILAQIDLFSGLPQGHLRRVVDIGLEEQYRIGATIFAEGEPGDKFYLIVEGAVRISRIVPGMGEEALAVLRPGAYFGEMSLIDDAPRSATAMCHEKCRLFVVNRPRPRGPAVRRPRSRLRAAVELGPHAVAPPARDQRQDDVPRHHLEVLAMRAASCARRRAARALSLAAVPIRCRPVRSASIVGVVAGTGADAKRLGFGFYVFGAQASWQPIDDRAAGGARRCGGRRCSG